LAQSELGVVDRGVEGIGNPTAKGRGGKTAQDKREGTRASGGEE